MNKFISNCFKLSKNNLNSFCIQKQIAENFQQNQFKLGVSQLYQVFNQNNQTQSFWNDIFNTIDINKLQDDTQITLLSICSQNLFDNQKITEQIQKKSQQFISQNQFNSENFSYLCLSMANNLNLSLEFWKLATQYIEINIDQFNMSQLSRIIYCLGFLNEKNIKFEILSEKLYQRYVQQRLYLSLSDLETLIKGLSNLNMLKFDFFEDFIFQNFKNIQNDSLISLLTTFSQLNLGSNKMWTYLTSQAIVRLRIFDQNEFCRICLTFSNLNLKPKEDEQIWKYIFSHFNEIFDELTNENFLFAIHGFSLIKQQYDNEEIWNRISMKIKNTNWSQQEKTYLEKIFENDKTFLNGLIQK